MDISSAPQVLNSHVSSILDQGDAAGIMKQEQFLMEHEEGTVKTFDVPIKREIYRVMKQWVRLPDGKRVIIGIVVSQP